MCPAAALHTNYLLVIHQLSGGSTEELIEGNTWLPGDRDPPAHSGLRYMGSAECFVVIDVREDGGGDLRAVTDVYRPPADETIWFSWEDDPAPGEIAVRPHVEAEVEGGQPEGRFWVRQADNTTKTGDVVVQSEQRTR